MFVFLILPVLVSGFIVCHENPFYRYRLHRFEGQYLYLKSAQLGVTALIIFSSIALLASNYLPATITLFGRDISLDIVSFLDSILGKSLVVAGQEDLSQYSWLVVLSIGSIAFAYFWSYASIAYLYKGEGLQFGASCFEKSKMRIIYNLLSDSPLDKLLFESFLFKRPLLISIDSRKVYVGTINSLGEPNESEGMDQEISFVPLMSGYRDSNDLNVSFATFYDAVSTDFNIVVRQDQVLSASFFNFDTYIELNPEFAEDGESNDDEPPA